MTTTRALAVVAPISSGAWFRSPLLRKRLMVVLLLAGVACDRTQDVESREDPKPAAPASSLPVPGAYTLDPIHSFIHFRAQHMVVGTVAGRFNTMTGTAVVGKDPATSTVDVALEASSIDTQNDARDAELRGPDFFDVAAFPTIEYHGTGLRREGGHWVVDGTLKAGGRQGSTA